MDHVGWSMKKAYLIAGMLIIVVAGLGFYVVNQWRYAHVIEANWSIMLPTSYDEIYKIDSGQSFLGDGQRFHVFEVRNQSDVIDALAWTNGPNSTIEESVTTLIRALKVDSAYRPDFQIPYRYYTQTKTDHSTIYLVYFETIQRLLIIEDIY